MSCSSNASQTQTFAMGLKLFGHSLNRLTLEQAGNSALAALASPERISSVQFSSAQFSSVQFSSVQFSLVQFSSVQFSSGQVRSGQVRSGQVRSGQVRSGQFGCQVICRVAGRGGAKGRDAWNHLQDFAPPLLQTFEEFHQLHKG